MEKKYIKYGENTEKNTQVHTKSNAILQFYDCYITLEENVQKMFFLFSVFYL